MGDIIFLTLAPLRFRHDISVGAPVNDIGYRLTESLANVLNTTTATGVFARIVEQGADRFIFISSVFQGDTRDAEQVRQIRDFRTFAELPSMNQNCVMKRLVKFRR